MQVVRRRKVKCTRGELKCEERNRIRERIKVQLVFKENIGCIRVKIICEGGFE